MTTIDDKSVVDSSQVVCLEELLILDSDHNKVEISEYLDKWSPENRD